MSNTGQRALANVLGVDIDALDMETTLAHIAMLLQERRKGYICFATVHSIMEARNSRQMATAYADAELSIPDGTPLAWVGRFQGHCDMGCVTGPDLMLEIFRRPEFAHVTHFLYGGTDGVAAELRDRLTREFPWVQIVGAATPPFHELSSAEQDSLVASIAQLKPDMIWVGLGCPKQERFMHRYLPLLDTRLMFGVGAAFDFHTGRIRACPAWAKRAGLHWLHRFLQNPRHTWRRNLRYNPSFMWNIALQLTGLRLYPTLAVGDRDERVEAVPEHCWCTSRRKRCFDVVLAGILLVISAPVQIAICIVIKMLSDSPVLFRQIRTGQNGKLFLIYKYRTMNEEQESDSFSVTKPGDPRITRLGRVLRRRKLDELPQLINILRGEMSFVGPRPRVPEQGSHLLVTRPGLTGIASLVLAHEERILQKISDEEQQQYRVQVLDPLKLRYDMQYIEAASLSLDIEIILRTVIKVYFSIGKGGADIQGIDLKAIKRRASSSAGVNTSRIESDF